MQDRASRNLIETGLLDGRRTFTTNKKYGRFLRPRKKGLYNAKPVGLWYAMEDSWIDWCLGEDFGGIGKYVYDIELNPEANIKFLDTVDDVLSFSKKYKRTDGFYANFPSVFINWERVMSEYDGIEIDPYFHELRFEHDLMWYYGWDVPSGCLWKASTKKKITLIAEYSERKNKFVIL
jgi:hypothetical protein